MLNKTDIKKNMSYDLRWDLNDFELNWKRKKQMVETKEKLP